MHDANRDTLEDPYRHYVLHSKRGKKKIRATRFGSNPVEWEATWFAAALLMPENDFRATCARHRNDTELVAARYVVNPKAAEVRMKALRIIA